MDLPTDSLEYITLDQITGRPQQPATNTECFIMGLLIGLIAAAVIQHMIRIWQRPN